MKKQILHLTFLFLIFHATNAQVPSYIPSNGLVGWWPFNGNANDESGNGTDGTPYNVNLTSDRFGNVNKAYSFGPDSSYIDCGNTASVKNISSAISISLWFYHPQYDSTPYEGMVTRWNQGLPDDDFWVAIQDSTLGYAFGTVGVDAAKRVDTPSYLTEVWNHYVVTYDSTGHVTAYLNAVKVSDSIYMPNGDLNGSYNINMYFGTEAPGFRQYKGKLDDIGMWNRVLTPTEVITIFNGAPNGINDIQIQTISLNPNPASDKITLSSAATMVGHEFSITDLTGRSLMNGTITNVNQSINISALSPSVYLLQVEGSEMQPIKFVKQ